MSIKVTQPTPSPEALLFKALSKAQSEFLPIRKNRTGYVPDGGTFAYADSAEIQEKTRQALSANGLCVMQLIEPTPKGDMLVTVLAHEAGASIRSVVMLNRFNNDQQYGASISLLRRYAKSAILDLSADDDTDSVSPFASQDIVSYLEADIGHCSGEPKEDDGFYPNDLFAKNIDDWQALIASGEISGEDLITTIESKHQLTEDQKQQINKVEA